MGNLTTIELKAFLPAQDFAISKQFYQDLGFIVYDLGADLACVSYGPSKFLLQRFYVKAFAENLQMHLLVEDVDSWWAHAQPIFETYGTMLRPPQSQPWGMRDFIFHDPSGIAWRIGQDIA